MILQETAGKVSKKLEANGIGFDIITILMLISIIISIIRMIQACNKKGGNGVKECSTMYKNGLSAAQDKVFGMAIRHHIGLVKYRQHGDIIKKVLAEYAESEDLTNLDKLMELQ